MITPDHNEIMSLKNGDAKEFSFIYDKYFKPLCIHAENMIECMDTAEDIVQELFVKLWENREKIEITTSFKAYLYGSVRNACLKYIEHLNVRREYHDVFVTENRDYDGNNPMSDLIAKETEQEIEQAIASLPKKHRSIINLIRHEEMSYEEIAKKLNLPIGSVGPLIMRAREKLKKLLDNKD